MAFLRVVICTCWSASSSSLHHAIWHSGQCLRVNCVICVLQTHVCLPGILSPMSWRWCLCRCALSPLAMLRPFKWHLRPSADYGELVDLLSSRNNPTIPTELAMMSIHSAHPTEEHHTEEQKQVGCRAAVLFLACRPWIWSAQQKMWSVIVNVSLSLIRFDACDAHGHGFESLLDMPF